MMRGFLAIVVLGLLDVCRTYAPAGKSRYVLNHDYENVEAVTINCKLNLPKLYIIVHRCEYS